MSGSSFPPTASSSQRLLHQSHPRIPATSSLPNLRRDYLIPHPHPMKSGPSSPLITNSPSPATLQNHIYASFLERRTADVALHVRGTWRAIYRLHRVILIQAGFFQSLFTSGFAESNLRSTAHRMGPEVIDIALDDPNITRAGCVLPIYTAEALPCSYRHSSIPTWKHPLTPGFSTHVSPSDELGATCPPGHHPASPRFLLSLLATSIFLSITPLATQAMTSILNTIGPFTVIRYLNFALGKGIGDVDEKDPEAAVGLESVAEIVNDEDESMLDHSISGTPRTTGTMDLTERLKESTLDSVADEDHDSDMDTRKEDSPDSTSSTHGVAEPSFFYGVLSDKIGEAAACWLTRWGIDMLEHELQLCSEGKLASIVSTLSSNSFGTRRRATTFSGSSSEFNHGAKLPSQNVPLIWRKGGLSARWVRGVLSSDALFVTGEKERYDMSRAAVELRRADGIVDEDESEYNLLFTRGIYYANMSLDDLMQISRDISLTTTKTFVPMQIIQSAYWDQSVLRQRIITRPSVPSASTSPPSSPTSVSPKPGQELGVALTSTELCAELKLGYAGEPGLDKPHYSVPADSSLRIGDSTGVEGASIDQLFESPSPARKTFESGSAGTAQFTEANFFGIEQQAQTAVACIHSDTTGQSRWSPYPPFRFGVEFWDVDALKEKSRLHSRTIWYAGSLWNVYVQVVRKKGVQLGVYLHRQSTIDPIPPASAPANSATIASRERSHTTGAGLHTTLSSSSVGRIGTPRPASASPSISSSLPTTYSSASSTSTTLPATAPPVTPSQPYRDPRSSVSAYFTVACASATGTSLTRFTSAPDVFSVSQSWGWKSSSLRTGDHMETGEDGMPAESISAPHASLRATVLLGVV